MGGNCLKKFGVETVRLPQETYFTYVEEVTSRLWESCGGAIVQMEDIRAMKQKESFGDMDVLYCGKELTVDDIRFAFPDSKAINKNGTVISFEYKDFQIDLIYSTVDAYNYASYYFADNDFLGNGVGVLAHKFGLKHGHDGLWLPIRDGDNMFASVLLTHSYLDTLDFLELDFRGPLGGFSTPEEAFQWLSKSPYYSPDHFKLENRNTIARVRDKKRTNYNFIVQRGLELEQAGFEPQFKFNKDKSVYLPKIFGAFPEAKVEYNAHIQKLGFTRYVKSRFNGRLVEELTGLTGKELGGFMTHLNKLFEFSQEQLCITSDDKIRENIVMQFVVYRNP